VGKGDGLKTNNRNRIYNMASGQTKKTLRELAVVIFSHWLAIVAITLIITGATVVACLMSKKVYR